MTRTTWRGNQSIFEIWRKRLKTSQSFPTAGNPDHRNTDTYILINTASRTERPRPLLRQLIVETVHWVTEIKQQV